MALPEFAWAQTVPRPGGGAGGSLPAGGTVGQVVVNTGPGAGSWQDPKVSIWDSTLTNTVIPVNAAPGSVVYGLPTWSVITDMAAHTLPTGDVGARGIYTRMCDAAGTCVTLNADGGVPIHVVNGSATATEGGNLTLGTASVAEAIAVAYGQVITDPSTMTLGTNGNGMRATYGAGGEAVVALNAVKGNLAKGTGSATGTGNTSVVAALGAGLSFCLTDIAISNSSATFSEVNMVDDVGGANTVIWGPVPAPATSGYTHLFGSPLCFSANKAAGFAAVTGVTTIKVSFLGYKTKE